MLAEAPTTATAPDTAGLPLISAPNWVVGQCVVCNRRRSWEDLKPYPAVGGVCARPSCEEKEQARLDQALCAAVHARFRTDSGWRS